MFDHCLYFNLSSLTRKINKIWQQKFRPLNLSPSHGYLLFAIVETPWVSQKELGKLMELDPSTITRFVDALAQQGFLEKKTRGKGAQFEVTSKGKKTCKQVKTAMKELFQSMQKHFGEDEFTSFVTGLQSVRTSFE